MNRRGAISVAGLAAVVTAAVAIVSAASGAPALTVSPSGNDATCARGGSVACASMVRAYQLAQAGDTIPVAAGTYPTQTIGPRADLRNLAPGCSKDDQSKCVHFVGSGVKIAGVLEEHGSDVFIDGGTDRLNPGFNVTGYVDTEADSDSVYPDHVLIQGVHSTSIGIFNAVVVTFRHMDVGPATIANVGTAPGTSPGPRCGTLEGPGIENKIGWAGGKTVVPTDVTLDDVKIHDQNGAKSREEADCHFGGLFLVTVNGLTITRSIFQGNVVYHIQIQNFGGAPPAQNVLIDSNTFGCAVDWVYKGVACDNQAAIQFDYPAPGFTITGNNTSGGLVGCYAGPCDSNQYAGDTIIGNTPFPQSVVAPPLPDGSSPPTTTAITTTTGTTTPTTTAIPPPSVKDLIDQGVALLKQTTVGYKNHPASWYANTTTNWYQGLQKLAQARAAAP